MELIDMILFALSQHVIWVCLYKSLFEREKPASIRFDLLQIVAMTVIYLPCVFFVKPLTTFITVGVFFLFAYVRDNAKPRIYGIKILFAYLVSAVLNIICSAPAHFVLYAIDIHEDIMTTIFTSAIKIPMCFIICSLCRKKDMAAISKDFRTELFVITMCLFYTMLTITSAPSNYALKLLATFVLAYCCLHAILWLRGEYIVDKQRKADAAKAARLAKEVEEKAAEVKALGSKTHLLNARLTGTERELKNIQANLARRSYLAEGAASLTEDVEANLRDLATLRKDETREQEREATRNLEVHTQIPALDRELKRLALEADEHRVFVECFVREDLSELLQENILSETDLLQIFDNLLRNAIKSIVRGDPSRRIISIYIKNENDAVCIRVSDSGDDFDPSVLENLGAPKNTTDGQGFGLVNILEALAKCNASFFINEYPAKAIGHKKDVTILFDGAGMLDIVLPYQERQRITIEEALKREIKKEENLYVPDR